MLNDRNLGFITQISERYEAELKRPCLSDTAESHKLSRGICMGQNPKKKKERKKSN